MLEKTRPVKYFLRDDEQDYARLPLVQAPQLNQYGKPIQLINENDSLAGDSLKINGDDAVYENPNRYMQHGFYFNADNCISCHACESACSEKNDLPPYLAYRSVGYLEGGSYPNYTRLNISMACNHCDNPVCLKGCPTRAYTKFAEYGAVLQDPDICFGCGYCTWVCPYNAPQLDTERGHVHKCNMCVDRLEMGLKPACASACLAGALDFGVIETTPENRHQLKTQIPGFPTPEITHPNIRFQQMRSLPDEMARTDSIAMKYRRSSAAGEYRPVLDDAKIETRRYWNMKKLLSSHENAHIIFTLATQAVIGAFVISMLGSITGIEEFSGISLYNLPMFLAMLALLSFGMLKLNLHLGRPHRFYRGFYNLKMSPVSREIAGVSLFFAGFVASGFFSLFDYPLADSMQKLSVVAAVLGGAVGLYYMIRLYLIPARPFWNHWQTASSFISSALVLGCGLILLVNLLSDQTANSPSLLHVLAMTMLAGTALEIIGLVFHAVKMRNTGGEGAVSFHEQVTKYGKSYFLRNFLLVMNMCVLAYIVVARPVAPLVDILIVFLVTAALFSSVISRALFYVLVIPTTMPGAFFWRNRGFQQHARETGLAELPQTGVQPETH